MNLSNTNFLLKGLRAAFGILSFCCLTVQAQNRYFTVKGKGVNVRKAPVSGSVIGKVSPPCSFYSEEKDGWVELLYKGQRGYISSRFVDEVELADFSRKHLGDYMGMSSPVYSDGYCLVTLKEKDGYVLMNIGDYSEPQEGGFRNQMFWTYVGIPEKNGVRFTHELYPYYEDMPVGEQMTGKTKMNDYVLVVGKDGTLYTPDRTLEPQETAQDAEDLPQTERKISYYGTPQTDGADNTGAADNNIYVAAEQNPEYPGGAAAMMTFIASNLRYPALCQENGIKGRVVLKFVVETDGSIGEIKTVSSPHYLLEKEAVRIVRKMPKWKPGRQSGRPVRAWYTVPVNFALD